MEATTGVNAGPNVNSSSSLRKEWRAVSEHQSTRNVGDEHGQERTDGFCSITIDGDLEQQLNSLARQRADLEQIEVELRAKVIVRSQLSKMQDEFDAQIKEHVNASIMLQEQLREKGHTIHELEMKLDEKNRELHAMKLDNEAAWAKEDLLREQNKELATFRRELDNSEFERSEHLQRMHDLQEHIQDKERKLIELQDQNRAAQEAIAYKDEQIREAQAWIARVQEMDVFHSSTNHSLQAELRERTEQYNQLWLGCQRQFTEMERVHLHVMQQLQIELAEARGKNGAYSDDTQVSEANLKDASHIGGKNGSQLSVNGNGESVPSDRASMQIEHAPGVPISQLSLFGMPNYHPSGEVVLSHPFAMHQKEASHAVPSDVLHSGSFHSTATNPCAHHLQTQQAVIEGIQMPSQYKYQSSLGDQNRMRLDADYNYDMSVNGQALHPEYINGHISQSGHPDSVDSPSTEEAQALETLDKRYPVTPQSQQQLQQISSEFQETLRLDSTPQSTESKEKTTLLFGEQSLMTSYAPSETSMNTGETTINSATDSLLPVANVADERTTKVTSDKSLDIGLLDERSLLACIVRTIPPGCKIRMDSTLPNRLGKMLAPLRWHDYKKKYGKLDDFVSSHPELFVIEEDHIYLQDGAKEKIAATAAVAKVAAAAAAANSHASFLPSMAVTPNAQSNRLKNTSSVNYGNGATSDRSGLAVNQNGGARSSTNFAGKPQTRTSGVAPTSRR